MELNEYQKRAMTTCTSSSYNFSYMALNLVSEVGEFMGKIAKAIRKEDGTIDDNELFVIGSKYELKQEAGDIMWQISGLCDVMGGH
jgi:NTP pyrophosphatase (non-canonical NTP hydrolase)